MKDLFNTAQRFSIRKYSIGAASVLLGAVFLSQGQLVSADEVTGSTLAVTDEISLVTPVQESGKAELPVVETPVENPVTEGAGVKESVTIETASVATESTVPSENATPIAEVAETTPVTKGYAAAVTERPTTAISTDTTRRRAAKNTRKAPEAFQDTARGFARTDVRPADLAEPVNPVIPESAEKAGEVGFLNARGGKAIGDDYPQYWRTPNLVDSWGYYTANCTSFVAHRLSKVNGFEMPRAIGHGGQWGDSARRLGYRVDNKPAPGSVAYFTSGQFGHVAWVAAVEGDQVLIEEYNWVRADGSYDHSYHVRYQPISSYSGFIHFKDLAGGQAAAVSHTNASAQQGVAQSGTYTFTKRSPIRAEANPSSPELAYYDAGQSVNYDRKVTENGYEWISYLSFAGNRRYIAIKETAKPAPKQEVTKPTTGTISIRNNNAQTGSFDIIVSNVYNAKGVQAVVVPTWSDKDGQDDIQWYEATRQADGTYKQTVKASDHKHSTGLYHAHLYYRQNDGSLVGAGGTTTTVSLQVTPRQQPSIPSSGTYHFTTRAAVRPEARLSSAELAHYSPGMSVNYDRVLQAEGRTWISYIAGSGNRRYIAIN